MLRSARTNPKVQAAERPAAHLLQCRISLSCACSRGACCHAVLSRLHLQRMTLPILIGQHRPDNFVSVALFGQHRPAC